MAENDGRAREALMEKLKEDDRRLRSVFQLSFAARVSTNVAQKEIDAMLMDGTLVFRDGRFVLND